MPSSNVNLFKELRLLGANSNSLKGAHIQMEVIFDSSQQVFHLRNQKLSYLIQLERFGYVTHLYFG